MGMDRDDVVTHGDVMRQRDSEEKARLDDLAARLAAAEERAGRLEGFAAFVRDLLGRCACDAVKGTGRKCLRCMAGAALATPSASEEEKPKKTAHETLANGGGPNECQHGIAAGISCPWCGTGGQLGPYASPAPAPLAWTTEPPKVAGDYLMRLKTNQRAVKFATFDEHALLSRYAHFYEYIGPIPVGPLPEPAEPGDGGCGDE
jgi:hypothetical protein